MPLIVSTWSGNHDTNSTFRFNGKLLNPNKPLNFSKKVDIYIYIYIIIDILVELQIEISYIEVV